MAQIKEYTPRNIYNPTERRESRLSLPDSIARAEGGRNSFVDNAKTVLKGAGEIAQVVVDMKTSYDKAKANEFLNAYTAASNDYAIKTEKERQLGNARGVSSDFANFQKNFLDNYEFENEEQKQYAANQFNTISASRLYSMSRYEAQQIQLFEKGQNEAIFANTIEFIGNSNDFEGFVFGKKGLEETVNNLMPGASEEEKALQVKKGMTQGILASINRMSSKDPIRALSVFDDDFIKENMDEKSYLEAKKNVVDSYILAAAKGAANVANYGTGFVNPAPLYNFLSEGEANAAKALINEKAVGFAAEISQENVKKNNDFLNKVTSTLFDSQETIEESSLSDVEKAKEEQQSAEAAAILAQNPDGKFVLEQLDDMSQKHAVDILNGTYPNMSYSYSRNFTEVKKRIMSGEHQNIASVLRDASEFGLPSEAKKDLIKFYNGNYKLNLHFKTEAGKAERKDLKAKYNAITQGDAKTIASDNVFYKIFERNVFNRIIKYNENMDMAFNNVYRSMVNPNDDSGAILRLMKNWYSSRDKKESVQKDSMDEFIEKTELDFISDGQKKDIALYANNGDYLGLYDYVGWVRRNEILRQKIQAEREQKAREERNRRIREGVQEVEKTVDKVVDYIGATIDTAKRAVF